MHMLLLDLESESAKCFIRFSTITTKRWLSKRFQVILIKQIVSGHVIFHKGMVHMKSDTLSTLPNWNVA